ncbi:hypothetical protein ACK8P5_00670 [Paenibacillus sp. EC2-1]|uniref:hypothetical protein n=1 Tax=Paenibacillus sp. EC2-1 TaxID=3388665 RepID=UPI003BEEF047
MPKPKREETLRHGRESYDLDGWEGGIAAYWIEGGHGTIVVAVPRIGVSALLLGNPSDRSNVIGALMRNRSFYYNKQQAEEFADLILRDIRGLMAV